MKKCKRMTHPLFLLVLALVLAFAVTGCRKNEKDAGTDVTASSAAVTESGAESETTALLEVGGDLVVEVPESMDTFGE